MHAIQSSCKTIRSILLIPSSLNSTKTMQTSSSSLFPTSQPEKDSLFSAPKESLFGDLATLSPQLMTDKPPAATQQLLDMCSSFLTTYSVTIWSCTVPECAFCYNHAELGRTYRATCRFYVQVFIDMSLN